MEVIDFIAYAPNKVIHKMATEATITTEVSIISSPFVNILSN
jgi:hypothetical protein